MKDRKILVTTLVLFGILLIFGAATTTAQTSDLGDFKQGSCVNLIQTCASCTFSNVTSVLQPDSELSVIDSTMTQTGSYYNYSYCDTHDLGKYIVNGIGDIDGTNEVWTYEFEIKPESGLITNIDNFPYYLMILLAVLLWTYHRISRFLASLGLFLLGLAILFIEPLAGWFGWMIIIIGLLSIVYNIFVPRKTVRRRR